VKYEVQVVGEDELPNGVKRVIVERAGDDPLLILAESAAQTWLFMQHWEADRQECVEVFELRAVG